MIRCTCTDNDGTVISGIRWYDPDKRLLPSFGTDKFVVGAPHFTRPEADGNDNTNVTLVIPTFNDSYDGTYTCGRRDGDDPPAPPTASVHLIIYGEVHVINVIP